ncbi:MAG: hypothetical protein R2932_43995 [Caldilineaceae bacterium]
MASGFWRKSQRPDKSFCPGAVVIIDVKSQFGLEADAVVLDTRIRNGDEPDFLVAGADVRDVEAEHFQAFFELFDGEVVLMQHDGVPFEKWLIY